jgi:serine/threonine protein kinase/tetratricopeptide (TPR) repeat protein
MLQPPQPHNAADPFTMAFPLDPIASLRAALSGHYEIEREIGQGAFATVYLARDLKHERKVAVKVLHADPSSETGELRFIREIRLLARLQHPNILPLHDSGHVETLLYYVMPYVSGETLRDRIDRERQLVPNVACNIARDVADALAYAHAQGVIHRDIKPENILLSAGHPVLADFGIARAIDLAGVRQLTRTGRGSPGTPAYMSPEQLMGDKELDGRSDTYSLGCVLFEMLTGKPPFAGKEGFVKRFTEDPPRPSSVRKDLVPWIDDVVTRALAKSPDDRYQTAQELATALTAPDTISAEPQPVEHLPPWAHHAARSSTQDAHPKKYSSEEVRLAMAMARGEGIGKHISFSEESSGATWLALVRKYRISVAVGAVLLVIAAVAVARNKIPSLRNSFFAASPSLDTARFVVLPFAPAGTGTRDGAARATEALYDAFTQWSGLSLVTDTRVAQAIAERGTAPATEREALALARDMRAGKLVWGNVSDLTKPPRIRVHLYDVATGETRDDFFLPPTGDDTRNYANVALRLLGANRLPAASGGDGLTKSYPAWSAYGLAHAAMRQWNLEEAEREFRRSIAADGEYAPPRIWLAQLLAWKIPGTGGEWRAQNARAATGAGLLAPRERTLTAALSALAAYKYPEACQKYGDLVRTDAKDFVGLFGMGMCRELDSTVVPTSSSPSKWRFRSSYATAADAYMRALGIDPGGHRILTFDRLQHLLPTAPMQHRIGINSEQQIFAAFPSLFNDTVGFIPYPLDKFATLSDRSTSAKRYAAMEHDGEVLLGFASDWAQHSPDSPDAFEALANILESRGDLSDGASGRLSALGAIHRARELAQTSEQKLRVGAREVSIHFKRSEFALARALADSVLREASDTDEANMRLLSGLAALTGKVDKTTELVLRTGAYVPPSNVSIPTQVSRAAAAFFASAALGVCGSYLQDAEHRLDQAIQGNVPEEDRERMQTELKQRPVTLMAACNNARSSLQFRNPQDRVLQMQQDLARNEFRSLKLHLRQVQEELRVQRPADLSLDYVYQLSWLRAASGDTAGAITQLDVALGALQSLSSMWIWDVPTASAAVRAMALRADLATAQHDRQTAKRWATAVTMLWIAADPPLQPFVTRMRSMSLAQR